MLQFYSWAHRWNIPLNGQLLMEKTEAIAEEAGVNFNLTDGWFSRRKKRNGLTFITLQGSWQSLRHQVLMILRRTNGQFWCANLIGRTFLTPMKQGCTSLLFLIRRTSKKLRKKTAKGFKTSNYRITALVTCSIEGEEFHFWSFESPNRQGLLKARNYPRTLCTSSAKMHEWRQRFGKVFSWAWPPDGVAAAKNLTFGH